MEDGCDGKALRCGVWRGGKTSTLDLNLLMCGTAEALRAKAQGRFDFELVPGASSGLWSLRANAAGNMCACTRAHMHVHVCMCTCAVYMHC